MLSYEDAEEEVIHETCVWSDLLRMLSPQVDHSGFPGGEEPVCQCRRHKRLKFNPWIRIIPWTHTRHAPGPGPAGNPTFLPPSPRLASAPIYQAGADTAVPRNCSWEPGCSATCSWEGTAPHFKAQPARVSPPPELVGLKGAAWI